MSHTNTDELKKIPLGSGELYVIPWTGKVPEDLSIEQDENKIGFIKNGATISYSSEYYTAKSDNGKATKTRLVSETATFNYGLITWNAVTVSKLISTTTISSPMEPKPKRTLLIGGVEKDDQRLYLWRFVVKDKKDGDIRITVVGKNTGGWSAAFQNSQESILQPSIQCEPLDDNGTLIIYEEEQLTESSADPVSLKMSSPAGILSKEPSNPDVISDKEQIEEEPSKPDMITDEEQVEEESEIF